MKRAIVVMSLLALAALSVRPALAQSHHGHGGHGLSLGLHFGVPFAWYDPYYYYPPPYYYPPAVVAPATPPVYVERGDAAPEPAQNWWYYCEQSRGDYPLCEELPARLAARFADAAGKVRKHSSRAPLALRDADGGS